MCFNTALLPADKREEMFAEMQSSMGVDDDEFDDFRRSVLEPMIARHEQMFPMLHQRLRAPASVGGRSSWLEPRPLASEPRAARLEACDGDRLRELSRALLSAHSLEELGLGGPESG